MQKMARQGKMARDARTQGIGMPSSSACRQGIIGIGNCHHRHAIIGMPSSACHHRHAVKASSSAAAGRRTAERSKVAQYSHTDFERVLRCAVVKIFE